MPDDRLRDTRERWSGISLPLMRYDSLSNPVIFLQPPGTKCYAFPKTTTWNWVPRLRKLLKMALLVCLAIAAFPAAIAIMISFWIWSVNAEADKFYRDHPLLGEMRAVEKQSTNNSEAARAVFLKIVPPGTDRQSAITMLRKETLNCQGAIGPLLTCQTMSPSGLGQLQWILYLDFDADERLTDARIAIWSIFL